MTEDTRRTPRARASVPLEIEVAEAELEQILPLVRRNMAVVSRLAPRIAFEDEPALYARVMETAKG